MDGVLVLDKPAGITSTSMLNRLKEMHGPDLRLGHAGTLDPFATGVLVVLAGEATRLFDLALSLPKRYLARVHFGLETDTLDPDGEVVRIADAGPHAPENLAEVLAAHTGTVRQEPPAYSALRVRGRRAYELARKGHDPALRARDVRIDAIRVRDLSWPELGIEVLCGSGTYLRSLARDLGRALSLPASLRALRRTAVGPYRAEHAYSVEDGSPLAWRPVSELAEAAGYLPLDAPHERALRFAQGVFLPSPEPPGRVAVLWKGRFAGLGRIGPEGLLRAELVFRSTRAVLEAKAE